MSVAASDNEIRTITHSASGASLRIHPFGATVVGYTDGSGREVIFVSKLAKLDGTAPIRGGIPLVFPIFGPSTVPGSTMPQHGYARRNVWRYGGSYDNAERGVAGCRFELKLSNVTDGLGSGNDWADGHYQCTLVLTAECDATTLTTSLEIRNTGVIAFPFQALQHTYFAVRHHAALQADQCFVKGLAGYTVTDKVTKATPHVNEVEQIAITGEVDRVYDPPRDGDDDGKTTTTTRQNEVQVTVRAGADDAVVRMTARGVVDDTSVPVSCVVWNPHVEKAKSMADFADDEYHDMVCVEPGILLECVILEAGKTATLTQEITTL
jgi:glucose-6-phosphate 1-epimerase